MTTKQNIKRTDDAIDILHHRRYQGRPERLAGLEQERLNARIAHAIYKLRTDANMTQKELAALVGTKASAISRLENADYRGHSLAMLGKIASVFSGRLRVTIVPTGRSRARLCTPSGRKLSKEHVLA